MTVKEKSFTDKLATSTADALNPLNVLWALAKFFLFGLLIGLPFLIYNLNRVFNLENTNFISYLKALGLTLWQGVFLGLSTVADTTVKMVSGTIGKNYASIGFSILILVFATLTIHEIVRFVANIVDLKKGHATPILVTLVLAFFITFLLVTPLAYISLGGKTITSSVNGSETFLDFSNGVNQSNNTNSNESLNNTNNVSDEYYVNQIDLLYNNTGGT